MYTICAFNQIMKEFATDLKDTFPDHGDIQKACTALMLVPDDERICMDKFMEAVNPYKEEIARKDIHVLSKLKIEFEAPIIGTINIEFDQLVKNGVSDKTIDAIFEYVTTMMYIGTAVSLIPNDVLSTIENISQQIGNDIQTGNLPPDQIMSSIMGHMPNIMSNISKSIPHLKKE